MHRTTMIPKGSGHQALQVCWVLHTFSLKFWPENGNIAKQLLDLINNNSTEGI